MCRDRSELQNLIATLQEQKSHPGEKSRSATPSTIESDVASVEGPLVIRMALLLICFIDYCAYECVVCFNGKS